MTENFSAEKRLQSELSQELPFACPPQPVSPAVYPDDDLNRQITQLEQDPVNLININDDIELLKRKKLKLKDHLYQILKTTSVQTQI